MNKIINGKEVANIFKRKLKEEINNFLCMPKLAVIQIGSLDASNIYIKHKQKACKEVGISFELITYDNNIDEIVIKNKIEELNGNPSINGILIQLPLPSHLDSKKIINYIDPKKDVDGLTSINMAHLFNNVDNDEAIAPCTPIGIMKLLEYYNIELEGEHVVMIGRSNLVGKPLLSLFLNKNATITICHSKTKELACFTKQADILVVATGCKHLINKNMIKENAILIDVGINNVEGKLYGDIDYNDVYDKCLLITPVPGGVGPMTIAMLLHNVVECYKIQNKHSITS